MKRKLIALALSTTLVLSFSSCGSSDNVDKNSSENSEISSDSNPADKLVGRWEQSYLNNSDDESFEQYDSVTLDWEKRYIELYSNGKGVTDYMVGDYCNGGVALEWEVAYDDFYDKEVLRIYYAVEDDDCDEFGFKSNSRNEINLNFKDAKIEGKEEERNVPVEKYESPIETISFRFFEDYKPFVKVDDFTDNPDLGCENAFKSIESYRADPDTYDAQFE